MSLSDETLVQKSKKGDLNAFNELVLRYEGKVFSIAYRFMGNHADASDLAQETFIRLYQSLASFRGDSSFSTWLYRITANACRDELRKHQRRRSISMDEMIAASPANVPVADNAYSPEDAVQRNEVQRQVQECLNELSDDHRLILVMREIQGFSYDEIAEVLQCSLGTVKSRISRARNALKERLKRKGELLSTESRLTEKGGKKSALPGH
ncbi:RNA polymerase, sigma-24 subunit, RpoE [Desulfotomaculum arcticum]|uniref:RNA polymerase, sigma-24 subunit, RpoE n=1 Tax=Desulfotruncus arcticus DSM 17038 TaxID=1121424 RepID=A0A1I2Z194_9FIRM|nr:sigma-70 family RNA polymerase sigma factor [Desulfotruncus arcticus]SFH31662.1 RNA polymerase, sigma-24 subunit, RpoE [Desulfotomaculum arcticum] [Desulfotruncus arcticus DSM 17038]